MQKLQTIFITFMKIRFVKPTKLFKSTEIHMSLQKSMRVIEYKMKKKF